MKINNSTNINKTNNHISPKERLNSDDHQFTNINKTNNHISPKESLSSDGQQFHQYHQSKRKFKHQNKRKFKYQNKRKLKEWWSTIPSISSKQKKV